MGRSLGVGAGRGPIRTEESLLRAVVWAMAREDLDPELIGPVSLALADSIDLGRVQLIALPAALPLTGTTDWHE